MQNEEKLYKLINVGCFITVVGLFAGGIGLCAGLFMFQLPLIIRSLVLGVCSLVLLIFFSDYEGFPINILSKALIAVSTVVVIVLLTMSTLDAVTTVKGWVQTARFGFTPNILAVRNDHGSKYLVIDAKNMVVLADVLDPSVEASSLDELAGVITIEYSTNKVGHYSDNSANAYEHVAELKLLDARDGSLVSSRTVRGGTPPQTVTVIFFNFDRYGSEVSRSDIASACADLINSWERMRGTALPQ